MNIDKKVVDLLNNLGYQIDNQEKNNKFVFLKLDQHKNKQNQKIIFEKYYAHFADEDGTEDIITDIYFEFEENHLIKISSNENTHNLSVKDKTINNDYELLMRFCDQDFCETKIGNLIGVGEIYFLNYDIQPLARVLSRTSAKYCGEEKNKNLSKRIWKIGNYEIVLFIYFGTNKSYQLQLVYDPYDLDKMHNFCAAFNFNVLTKPENYLEDAIESFLETDVLSKNIEQILGVC